MKNFAHYQMGVQFEQKIEVKKCKCIRNHRGVGKKCDLDVSGDSTT